jgi:hypothetical protein
MFTDFQFNEAQFNALQEGIARHTVLISMSKGQEVGTGTLLSYGPTNLILTANHNLQGPHLSELRFGFNHGGNLQAAGTSEAATKKPLPYYTFRFRDRDEIFRDQKNDIAALILHPTEKPRGVAAFYDASALKSLTIPDGKSIVFLGFPAGNSSDIGQGKRLVSPVSEHSRYDSTLNQSKYLPSSYNPNCEFLLKYELIEDGLRPHGFSGAGAWCPLEPKGAIWTPDLILVGVITSYLKEQQLLVLAGLRAIEELLSHI